MAFASARLTAPPDTATVPKSFAPLASVTALLLPLSVARPVTATVLAPSCVMLPVPLLALSAPPTLVMPAPKTMPLAVAFRSPVLPATVRTPPAFKVALVALVSATAIALVSVN